MASSIRLINRDINSKSSAIKRFEREEGRKATTIEKSRICSEFYGVYFKY